MAGITGLDHINIRTTDMAASIAFYTRVLGLSATPPVELVPPATANWLFDPSGRPIIHLRRLEPDGVATGAFDHVALRCAGLDDMIARLEAAGIAHDRFEGAPGGPRLLVTDPHGLRLELIFEG